MQSNPIVYQTFSSKDLAIELTNLLSENNIAFKTEVFNATFDSAFTNNSSKDYVVKINPSDFEKVDALLLESMKDEIEKVNDDYYLFQFSNEELFDLIRKRDEWSQFDVLLAKKILQSKNIAFSQELDNKIKQERISELAEPKNLKASYYYLGIILSLLGGLLGLLIGIDIMTSKKTLPNGIRVYTYSQEDRKKGKNLIYIFIIFGIIAFTLLKLMYRN
jgi:hypothetical protein